MAAQDKPIPWSKSSDGKQNNQEHVDSRNCTVPFGGLVASFIRPDSQEPDSENEWMAKLCGLCRRQCRRSRRVHLYSNYLIALYERYVQSLFDSQQQSLRRCPVVEAAGCSQWRLQPQVRRGLLSDCASERPGAGI